MSDEVQDNRMWWMDDKQTPIFYSWLRLVFSHRGIWCFLPGILGAFFVYWAEAKGYQALILKEHQERIAIGLMGVATVLFLMRALCYRMEIDFILAVMSVNFLRREIHFVGTDNGVVIVAGLVLIWILIRKNQIWVVNNKYFPYRTLRGVGSTSRRPGRAETPVRRRSYHAR
ncbi:MAG: hypothetical protein PVF37_20420 [Desulfobacterales bacterium]